MTSFRIIASSIVVLTMVLPALAQTQIQPPTLRPSDRPTTSPYLLLGPNSAVFQRELNFFNQRRNERRLNTVNRELRVESRRLNESINELQSPSTILPTQPLKQRTTGHPTTFFNTYDYFPSRRSR